MKIVRAKVLEKFKQLEKDTPFKYESDHVIELSDHMIGHLMLDDVYAKLSEDGADQFIGDLDDSKENKKANGIGILFFVSGSIY